MESFTARHRLLPARVPVPDLRQYCSPAVRLRGWKRSLPSLPARRVLAREAMLTVATVTVTAGAVATLAR